MDQRRPGHPDGPVWRVAVIGGGIGGLTAAAALRRQGHRVDVYERARSLEPVGAGIGLAANALRALDVIGVGDAVRELAAMGGTDGGSAAGLRRPDGRWLVRTDTAALARHSGEPVAVAARPDVVELLARAAGPGSVHTGRTAAVVDRGGPARPAVVRLGDGAEREADLVVAADGVHSRTRAALWPDAPGPAPSGHTAWRALLPHPAPHGPADAPEVYGETWGRGLLFGITRISGDRLYWYASAPTPAAPPGGTESDLLRRLFGRWHAPIPALLAATPEERVLRNDILESATALPAHHRGRVALLGDAAHAMAPNIGQGGCQAVEDAVVLAHHIGRRTPDQAAEALAAYSAERLPRTTRIVRTAHRAASAARATAAPAVAVRDALLTAVGRFAPGLTARGMDAVLDWHPPSA